MAPQDTFIDDEEDTCPLCIEEFDLSDRNFRPCPCGYQICQFCYNNLKNNLNGLCPACRRPYDEKDIQWKVVTHEEEAEFRANIQKNQKKRASEQRQKEAQKREAEKESRKNLQGVRVVQKNLVYVTGLTPTVREDELLKTLRKHEFFGQYGNIQKISISNRKSSDGQQQSLGIYVTFEKKEDAARCIQAVDGLINGDRHLKAQLGTTKYCSAWLRHEQCGNRQCMFLHELGDEEDSYTRQDLSSLNSVHTQRPLASTASSAARSVSRPQPLKVPPPAVSQPMARSSSKEGSEAGGTDGPALPPSANWARTNQQRSRRGSQATSGATSSPAPSNSLPVTAESSHEINDPTSNSETASPSKKQSTDTLPQAEAAGKPLSKYEDKWEGFGRIMKVLLSIPPSAFICHAVDEEADHYLPLFDLNGAERRRAMRDEEENRLGDHDEQVDHLAQSDGEPESGSLALGGEPEDRDHVRNGLDFDPGRNAPIQRDLFGPSITALGQGSTSVGSIGSRTMTPQQQLFMRPQGNFTDQMPIGISQQSSLFQGQGHTRQQSRFSFANDSSVSSVSVKSNGDPRYMAQQTSMMPSSYRSGNQQLYPASVSGPPPGLKSTGTPPVGGNMFGQGHGFGASTFGSGSKDSPNDLLQSLIRRTAGGSQAHDQGKREYQFPQFSSFHSQYPSSSTSSTPAPAPAPALLASLYASQPGAFPDYGPKQKKKGKKHRHANTSSSGGSGLVDLADPGILQARMHHQQQGNNIGAGQGLFGGQSQDDDLLPLDEASLAVDALISDPDPLDAGEFALHDQVATPSLPPGLDVGNMVYQPTAPSNENDPGLAAHDRPPSGIKVGLATPPAPRPATPLTSKQAGKSTHLESSGSKNAKKSIKELANTSGLAQDIASQASKSAKATLLQEKDFPALDSAKIGSPSKPSAKVTQSAMTAPGKKANEDVTSKATAEQKSKKSEKRPVPDVLDIAAATNPVSKQQAADPKSETSTKDPQSSALPTPTPTTASVSSPLVRTAPKTLRLVQTPKTESPTTNIAPAAITSIRSAATALSAHRPMTPTSEAVSDTASIVSASISVSRTSSPPPSKIGSLPARSTTKSQQRKQRKEASKGAAAQLAETKPFEPEVEIAPILGRKKKQKKDKKTNVASRTSSRPATPNASEPVEDEASVQKSEVKQVAEASHKTGNPAADAASKSKEQKDKDLDSRPQSPVIIDTSIKLNESTKTTVLTPDYVNLAPEVKNEPTVEEDIGEIPQFREVFRKMVESGNLPEPELMSFFKAPPTGRSDSGGHGSATRPPNLKTIVTKEDEERLNAFQPVRKTVNDHYVLLTPNGDCLLNLTPAEADLFLDLQDRLRADSIQPTAFSAPRYAPAGGFSLVKNRAVPNGTPSFFPLGPDNYPSDPVGKMHREEAINCINQHVLPSLNLGNYKTLGGSSNFTKNVNLQQLAPWIYPPTENGDDQRKSLPGDYPGQAGRNSSADGSYGSYDQGEGYPSPAIGSTPLMSVEDAETVWASAKKQHEALDKKFRQLQSKNRRLMDMH
ncbi:hypothetical protein F5Y16DRAFT_390640 [Xylariaceae sp. FL0255]|nr:hypothetical protein F5Y16DRAFT_390640 [Xylariaceae sp. FL0255]